MPNEVITLGCRLNTFESEAMKKLSQEAGHDDLIIVNTCAVTAEAVRQARQTIRRLKRENPEKRIIVTGCAAQTEPETFAEMGEVAQIIGNDQKLQPELWQKAIPSLETWKKNGLSLEASERILVNDPASITETAAHMLTSSNLAAPAFSPPMIEGIEGRARAFVQVQNGCDHRCTFCIIPYGRGASRSVPMGEVVAQAKRLVDNGYQEIILTGVDLTAYGADLPTKPRLGQLVEALLRHVPHLQRLRLSSIDSIEVDSVLQALLRCEKRLMPHLHLSLQAGDNLILKRMKRRHTREEAIAFCQEMRAARPDFVFGADLIAGFPTESEEMFLQSLALIEDCNLTFLHVFPFSPRKGTPAARMPQLEKTIIKARAARLRAAGEAALHRHFDSMLGWEGLALVEQPGRARLENFMPIHFEGEAESGALLRLRVTHHDLVALKGEVLP